MDGVHHYLFAHVLWDCEQVLFDFLYLAFKSGSVGYGSRNIALAGFSRDDLVFKSQELDVAFTDICNQRFLRRQFQFHAFTEKCSNTFFPKCGMGFAVSDDDKIVRISHEDAGNQVASFPECRHFHRLVAVVRMHALVYPLFGDVFIQNVQIDVR